jgi:exodeoxyribonuclease VII large subunit
VDPRRVVERGYAILRLADGRALVDAEAAPAGSAVDAELRRGALRLRSEGPRGDP